MKILYGVGGNGMGHATRSRVVLEHLCRSHEVHIVASHRAHDYLARRFPHVRRIWGMEMAYGDWRIYRARSVLKALGGLVVGGIPNMGKLLQVLATERYDLVVSDFESFSHALGQLSGIPIITIDNIQALLHLRPGAAFTRGKILDYHAARAFVRLTATGATHRIIPSFFQLDSGDVRTTIVPPILRPEILSAVPENGSHLLVYQTADGNRELVDVLRRAQVPCRCYGIVRDIDRPVTVDQVTHKPFSEVGLVEDLRTAAAVVTNGGFTLMSEALHLYKPVLSIPLAYHVEQAMNAYHLARLGFGVTAERLTPAIVAELLGRRSQLASALRRLPRDGNAQLVRCLDGLLTELQSNRKAA